MDPFICVRRLLRKHGKKLALKAPQLPGEMNLGASEAETQDYTQEMGLEYLQGVPLFSCQASDTLACVVGVCHLFQIYLL